jgi:hypothetical protein
MSQPLDDQYLELLERLVNRLERLSADSIYAHQASGLRGTLLRYIERVEAGTDVSHAEMDQLVEYSFEILRLAAEEIGAQDER